MDKIWNRIKGTMERSKGKFQEYSDISKKKLKEYSGKSKERIQDFSGKSKEKIQEYTEKAKEKAEESKEVVKLRIRKVNLERKIYKNLAKMGSEVYDSMKKGKKNLTNIPNIDHLLNDTKKLDEKLMHIMSILDDLSKS